MKCPICQTDIEQVKYVCSKHYRVPKFLGAYKITDTIENALGDTIYCNHCKELIPLSRLLYIENKVKCPNCDNIIENPQYVDSRQKINIIPSEKKGWLWKKEVTPDCPECIKEIAVDINSHIPADSVFCEHCGSIFPGFCVDPKITVIPICLAGMPQSGKTCFRAMVRQTLQSLFTISPELDILADKYSYKPVVRQGELLPDRTPFEGDMFIRPEYIPFIKKEKTYVLAIYDIPGEVLSLGASKCKNVLHCINNIDNILMFLDPLSSLEGFYRQGERESLYAPETVYKCFHALIGYILDFAKHNKKFSKRKRIAFVVSKADLVSNAFRSISPIKYGSSSAKKRKAFYDGYNSPINPDYTDYKASKWSPDEQVKKFIQSTCNGWNYLRLFSPEQKDYPIRKENIRYFAVSSLGLESEIDESGDHKPVLKKSDNPFRILDPIMWLIEEAGK